VISFPWASDLAYRVKGESPPQRQAASPPVQVTEAFAETTPAAFDPVMLNEPLAAAMTRVEDWRKITAYVSDDAEAPIRIDVEQGWGGEPQKRHTLAFDAATGDETSYATFGDQSPGRRLRTFMRFAHTGEFFGILGQTLAGLASLVGVLLVWSGLALAWRRLARPLLARLTHGRPLTPAVAVGGAGARDLSKPAPALEGPYLRLVDVPLGERVSLVRIDVPDDEMDSLLEKGLSLGCDLCPIRRTPSGHRVIEVDGSVLTVRHEVAACLCVQRSKKDV
jgi:uncharacterized iron-regulated membrane protein